MMMNAGPNLLDPRGRLLPRSYDVLGLYTTFIFQKPDPDVVPPLATPLLPDSSYDNDEARKISEQKGILGPGPAELRFSEAL
ncbi:hypothetical protein GOBAR_DD31817 [Gossypium barbadense]|nr:hypothetical protein GOBAR_DD31817 [Gossypium barbadense]